MPISENPPPRETTAFEKRTLRRIYIALFTILSSLLFGAAFIFYIHSKPASEDSLQELAELPAPAIVDGRDVESGLIAEGDYLLVKQNCTSCHSGAIITQNRMSRDSWLTTIEWMQETQNLPELGDNEAPILDYLEKYYAPEKKGRRPRLQNIEWYELN